MKTEKVFRLPSMLHRHSVSDQLISEFIAFVGEVTSQKFVFLSDTENIVMEQEPVFKEQLPPDIKLFYLKIEGPNAFVEVKSRCRFSNFTEISDATLNSITIQGRNPVAVRGLESRIRQLVMPQRFQTRTIFYFFPLTWFWSSLVLLWFAEYRVMRLIHPSLALGSPLSALGAIVIFAIALGTALVYGNFILPVFSHFFPYFEIEGNISNSRSGAQMLVGGVWASILASGIWNLIDLLRSNSGH